MKQIWGVTLLGLTLVACGSGSNGTGSTPAPLSISGKVNGFAGAANTPIVLSLYFAGQAASSPVARGVIAADGSFSLTLPDQSAFADFLQPLQGSINYPGCTGTLTSSDTAAKGSSFRYLTVGGTSGYNVVAAQASGSSVVVRDYVYADRATTVTGNLTCMTTLAGVTVNGPVTVNLALKAGWNVLNETVSSGGITVAVGDNSATTWVQTSTN